MLTEPYGSLLGGDPDRIRHSREKWQNQPVDEEIMDGPSGVREMQTGLAESRSVTGPGTFFGSAQRTLTFEPTTRKGWWFDRRDLPGSMPIRVSVNSVWTTARNIVLCSGSPHNYMRMVEHMIALKLGMGLDNVVLSMDSGDPPLFDRSSMDLVEAVEAAGIVESSRPATYVTVKEPVTLGGPGGSFLTFLPAENGSKELFIDCAVDFKSAIGTQRIRFKVNRDTLSRGALARTNTPLWMMLYVKTLGMLFADTRHLGYTTKNILIAGRRRYFNEPGLVHNGKSLEAVWHRATLDLLAALSLIDRGRLAGTVLSYRAGHTLDVQMIQQLYQRDLLEVLA